MAFLTPAPLSPACPRTSTPLTSSRPPAAPAPSRAKSAPRAVLQADHDQQQQQQQQQRHSPSRARPASNPRSVSDKPAPAPGTPGHRFFDYSPDDIEAVRIRHCVVATEELAASVFSAVSSGATTLAEVASSLSTCAASRARGGDLGWWWKDEAAPRDVGEFGVTDALLGAAMRVRPQTVQRVRSPAGWHVFVVEEARHVLRVATARTPIRQNPNQRSRKRHADAPPPPLPGTYAVHTLGCQMNRSDSERMAGALEARGLRLVDDADRAAVLVLNTCNIREHAESKVYSFMGTHAARKRLYPTDVTLVVAGCVAQQEGERMLRRVPELDLVFGPQYANRVGDLLDEVARTGCQVAATEPVRITEDIATPRRESGVTAWVNVIYGCGENCTFCTVGNVVRVVEQSRSLDAIRAEVADVAARGFREVVLLGQNIDAYGRDMTPSVTFAQLLRHIHDVDGIERIRFTTSHPRYISDNLVRTCAELRKVMPFFHIPPQSGDSAMLKAMRRGYDVKAFLRVVDRIRHHLPDAAIAGDMIVGFPGETEQQFQHSLDLLEAVQFDAMNTAAYSPRPHTPAATMDKQVAEAVKSDRLQRMNDVVARVALERSKRYVGRVEQVLVEDRSAKDGGDVVGRMPTNRPVYFRGDIDALRGKLVDVRITDAMAFSVRGEMVGEPT